MLRHPRLPPPRPRLLLTPLPPPRLHCALRRVRHHHHPRRVLLPEHCVRRLAAAAPREIRPRRPYLYCSATKNVAGTSRRRLRLALLLLLLLVEGL